VTICKTGTSLYCQFTPLYAILSPKFPSGISEDLKGK